VLLAIVGATLGKVAIVGMMSPFHIQRSVAVLRPLAPCLSYRFLAVFLKSDCFQSVLWQNVGFSAQPGIYLGAIADFSIAVPLLAEQIEIVNHLDRETSKINELMQKNTQAVELLKEHRSALISAAVTGKIDVRQCAA
jgi:type I restriction enzyme S subunit